jgi:hypothetical protein
LNEIDLGGIGYLLALTPNNSANSLAALHFALFLSRANVYQLPVKANGSGRKRAVSQHPRGRLLFGSEVPHTFLTKRFDSGAVVKGTGLTEKFDYDDYKNYMVKQPYPCS